MSRQVHKVVFRVDLCVLEHYKDSGVLDVVSDRVIAIRSGLVLEGWLHHASSSFGEVTRHHLTVEDVHAGVCVRWSMSEDFIGVL